MANHSVPDGAWIRARLEATAQSPSFRARRRDLCLVLGETEKARALEVILLAEMSARPAIHRFIEWTVYFVGHGLRVPEQFLPQTRGPLQLRDASLSFPDGVRTAAGKLPERDIDTDALARLWSGAATRQPGSLAGYGHVLRIASQILFGTTMSRTPRMNRRSARSRGR